MFDKVKKYAQYELENISKGFNADLSLERAYGAVMFVSFCGDYDSRLGDWWENEMLPKFEQARRPQA